MDADDTIFDFKKAEHDAFKKTIEDAGVKYTDERLALYSAINLSYWKKLERNEVKREDLKRLRFEDFFKEIGVENIDCSILCEEYTTNLSESSSLIDGALDFVKKLHSLGLKLYIITNGLIKVQEGRFERSGLSPYIDKMYISERMGVAKPDKAYFDLVFEDANISDKSEVIVLGDSLTSDMQGGKNAGVTTCRYIRDGIVEESDLCDYQITEYNQFFDILFT